MACDGAAPCRVPQAQCGRSALEPAPQRAHAGSEEVGRRVGGRSCWRCRETALHARRLAPVAVRWRRRGLCLEQRVQCPRDAARVAQAFHVFACVQRRNCQQLPARAAKQA